MTFVVTFSVYGEPQGKGRPRFRTTGKYVRTYTPAKTKTYEDEIRMMAHRAMGSSEPLETPISVYLYIAYGVPASYSKKRSKDCFDGVERPTKKPDIDNIAKAFLDAMNGIVYLDDKQVVDLHVTKVYETNPHVRLLIKEALI